jgi:hypothetical protein
LPRVNTRVFFFFFPPPFSKNPGDFTVSEGHGHPLVYFINCVVCPCVYLSVKVPS